MFGTYLFRELTNRRKQTAIISIGMALAIALVIIVNGVAAGVRDAQSTVLQSIYGVGTDITVTEPAQVNADTPGGRTGFDFGAADGAASDGATQLTQSRLTSAPGSTTFDASSLATVTGVAGVKEATATLTLRNVSFSGEIPTPGTARQPGGDQTGGADGAGGSAFDVTTFSVTGVDPNAVAVGPLTSVQLAEGAVFTSADSDANVAMLDSAYATSAGLAVGDTISIGGEDFTIVGTVESTTDAATASEVYIPLDVAQSVSTLDAQISTIYVQAESSTDISAIQTDIQTALPDTEVKTEADLASSVSGSLSTASSLVTSLGTWLSIIVLAAAFLMAILFTISGVTRRTREFGTLKAIGWSNRRVVAQVSGESLVQGLLGGVLGVALGLVGIWVVNLIGPTLSGSASTTALAIATGAGPAGGRGPFGAAQTAVTATDVTLQLPITGTIILVAVGLAILGGLLAGAIGGWRAARLRPAEALRSVA